MNLEQLDIPKNYIAILKKNGWALERLATASVQQLTVIPGIGLKIATEAIRSARGIVNAELLKRSSDKPPYMQLPDPPVQRSVRVQRIYKSMA